MMQLTGHNHRREIAGTTLVELMVAIAIGLLVLAALTVLFAYNSNARREIDSTSQQIENGRYALELLRDEIHQAGHFAIYDGSLATKQAITACIPRAGVALTAVNLGWAPGLMPLAIYGYASGDLPGAETCITNQKVNSDVLIVRRTESESKTAASVAGLTTEMFFQTTGCGDRSIDPASTPFLVGFGGSSFTLHGNPADHTKNCVDIAPVQKLVTRAYYVATCSVCTGGGDGIPTLRMVELTGGATSNVPLVEGIESLSLEYSIDSTGDGIADSVKRCKAGVDACVVADWGNVIAVKVRLLARNPSKTIGYSDPKTYDMGLAGSITPASDSANYPVEYKRHQYTSHVSAYNIAGGRE